MPLILLLGDLIFNSHQFPFRHFIFTTIVAVIYIIINKIKSCNGKAVYDIFDCGNVWLPFVALVILAVGHAIGYIMWRYLKAKKLAQKE